MIQLVIPMAGLGSRFATEGYVTPKPLLPVHGYEMYKVVLANLVTKDVSRVILICPEKFELSKSQEFLSKKLGVKTSVIEINYLPEGPAMSVGLSRSLIDMDLPVVTANSDQYIDFDAGQFYEKLNGENLTGQILTMEDSDPKWSFVRTDDKGLVREVVEKNPISNQATVGIYGFKRGRDLFEGIDEMVKSSDRTNNEFYIAPVYKYISGFKSPGVGILELGPVGDVMHGLGIPADYEAFLRSKASQDAILKTAKIFG